MCNGTFSAPRAREGWKALATSGRGRGQATAEQSWLRILCARDSQHFQVTPSIMLLPRYKHTQYGGQLLASGRCNAKWLTWMGSARLIQGRVHPQRGMIQVLHTGNTRFGHCAAVNNYTLELCQT